MNEPLHPASDIDNRQWNRDQVIDPEEWEPTEDEWQRLQAIRVLGRRVEKERFDICRPLRRYFYIDND